MKTELKRARAHYGTIAFLVLVLVVIDQLSKAYFVFRLGTHNSTTYLEFIQTYFLLWGELNGEGAITASYFPFQPSIGIWHPWIQFTLTTNTGAAWSLMTGNSFQLSFVSLGIAFALCFVWWRYFRFKLGMTLAMGAILGGALGNFIDRFRLKQVVDFIDVKIPYIGKLFTALGDPYDFPIFNIADSAAVCGTLALATYLIIVDIRGISQRRKKASATPVLPFPEGPQLDYDPDILESIKQSSPPGETRGESGSNNTAGAEPASVDSAKADTEAEDAG